MGRVVVNGVNQDYSETFAASVVKAGQVQNPSRAPFAITPHDVNKLAVIPSAVHVGGAGDITLRGIDGAADVVLKGLLAGSTLNIQPEYIRATGTTATFLVGLA